MGEVPWGVLGCAGIAEKVCAAVLEASNARVVAVASRSAEKAAAFAKDHAPGAKAYGSYQELLDDADIKVIYIPLPTALRAEWVTKAAQKGKHVLCEKPLAGDLATASGLIEACKQAGVLFMDDTMFLHSERLQEVKKIVDDQESFGRVTFVTSTFTIPFGNDPGWADNIRMKKDTEPLGCLGDLGWYCVRFSLWAFGYVLPEKVRCEYLDTTEEGVPLQALATLRFSEGRVATFDCSFKHVLRQWAEVVGQKRSLKIEDFVVSKNLTTSEYCVSAGGISNRALTFPIEATTTAHKDTLPQHSRLVECFSAQVLAGKLDDFWPQIALTTQRILVALDISAKKQGEWIEPGSIA